MIGAGCCVDCGFDVFSTVLAVLWLIECIVVFVCGVVVSCPRVELVVGFESWFAVPCCACCRGLCWRGCLVGVYVLPCMFAALL